MLENSRSQHIRAAFCVLFAGSLIALSHAQAPIMRHSFASSVIATKPLAYYRLQTTSGKSKVGSTTYKLRGGATAGTAGPIHTEIERDAYVKFDGKTGSILTTQTGGIATDCTILAWVNLVSLPSSKRRTYYVAGESQVGNDLDVQIESDDVLRFFTAGGGSISYQPAKGTLVGRWHMVVVTLHAGNSGSRQIFWDGKLAAHDTGGGTPNKTKPLSIGNSTYFSDRWFDGGIAEVALWNRVLSGSEIASIYAASRPLSTGE